MMESLFSNQKVEKYKAFGGPVVEKVLYDFVKDAADKFPDKEAIIEAWNGSVRRTTYKELIQKVNACCCCFLEIGVRKEDIVAIQLPNCLEQCIVRIALSKIGVISFSFSEALEEYDSSWLIEVTNPKFVIIPVASKKINYPEIYKGIKKNNPSIKDMFVVGWGAKIPSGFSVFEELVDINKLNKYPPNYLDQFKPTITDIWELISTSGTTGRPKISMQTPLQFLTAIGQSITKRTKFTADDVIVSVTSMAAGLSGVMWGFEMAMIKGAKVCLMHEFSPELVLKLIEQEKATAVGGVPAIMPRIFNHPDYGKYNVSSLRLATTAGGPFPIELAKKLIAAGIIPTNMYGASEASAPVTTGIDDIEATMEGQSGKRVEGFDLRIIDNNGKNVKHGEEGEVIWWSPAAGWFVPREANKKSFDEEGYYHSGDIGFINKKGFLRISGRKTDMILRGAQNISPKESEDILYQHPSIFDVVVAKMPDKELGEKACACVVLKEGKSITFEEMVEFLKKKKLTKYKYPERLEIVDKLPLSAGGKVSRVALTEYVGRKLKEEGKI